MTTPRAVCVTEDPALRRTLRRILQAAGSNVEFADSADALDASTPPQLIVLDPKSRRSADTARLSERFGQGTEVVMLGESLDTEDIVRALRHRSFNHLISELLDPDEVELVVTSVKMLKGDIFGLEKYLAWGVLVRQVDVSGYDDKRGALLEVAEYAKEVGARRQMVARIESVTDELLMNALYDAPAIRYGVRPRISERTRAGVGPIGDEQVILRFASDGRYFAVSARDAYGELKKEAILDNLARARAERGSPQARSEDGRGAGLGLYFILSSVTRFIANICPGQTTEVICLFDLKASGREVENCAKSLHVFVAPTIAS